MPKLEKGNKAGNRFSSINQPKNRGRKPSKLKQLSDVFQLEDRYNELSKQDIIRLLWSLITCTKSQLERIANHPEIPMIITAEIKALISDLKTGRINTVIKILDLTIGKTSQPVTIKRPMSSNAISENPKSRKEYEIELKKLRGEY